MKVLVTIFLCIYIVSFGCQQSKSNQRNQPTDKDKSNKNSLIIKNVSIDTKLFSYKYGLDSLMTFGSSKDEFLKAPAGLTIIGDDLYIYDSFNMRIKRIWLKNGEIIDNSDIIKECIDDICQIDKSVIAFTCKNSILVFDKDLKLEKEIFYDGKSGEVYILKSTEDTLSFFRGCFCGIYENVEGVDTIRKIPICILTPNYNILNDTVSCDQLKVNAEYLKLNIKGKRISVKQIEDGIIAISFNGKGMITKDTIPYLRMVKHLNVDFTNEWFVYFDNRHSDSLKILVISNPWK